MPSRNPPPCPDSHTVRLVTGQNVDSNGKRDHGRPFPSLLITFINVSCIRIIRVIRIRSYVGDCWAITLRTPQHDPTCQKSRSGYSLIRQTWRKNEGAWSAWACFGRKRVAARDSLSSTRDSTPSNTKTVGRY